ncbi:MAG: alpha/beta fold hydrolase [Pseudomonadales bacterium]
MKKTTVSLGNGIQLACIERPGCEVPLVLLHGITDNAFTWLPVLEGIDARCRVFALDFRGHGESDKPEAFYDAEAYAADVRHFIDEQIGEPVLLAGHSLGGVVAVQTGVTAPGLVRGLFLEDPPLYFVNDLNETYRALFEGTVLMASTLQAGSRSPDDWFEVMAAAPDPYSGRPGIETMGAEKIRQRIESIGLMKPKAMTDGLAGSLHWNTDQVLAGIRCPVTVITGNPALGAVMTGEEVARMQGIVPGMRAIGLNDVGHLIHDQKPDAWLEAVNGWIDEALTG